MTKIAFALLPLCFVLFLSQATQPSAELGGAGMEDIAAGALIYAENCARCHAAGVEWTEPGCRPASLSGATERYEKQQVMNLLDHGVMAMPSFATMPQEDRDRLWDFLSTLPAEPAAAPTPGQYCGRVKAAMAGAPMAGGCGGMGGGAGRAAGGGCGGGGCGGGGCGKAAAAAAPPALTACGKCEACKASEPGRFRRGRSFGR